MLNLEANEPHIEILTPLLRAYDADTAVLYGFLKYYVEKNNIKKLHFNGYTYYSFILTRYDIQSTIGLSDGRQIDSETNLIGAFLADVFPVDDKNLEYTIYPEHEDAVRRSIYKRELNWKFE